MDKLITCINCPVGCRMKVRVSEHGDILEVSGNTCPRGDAYARQECIQPLRMITAVIPASECEVPLSVKTSMPVPRDMIREIMLELSRISVVPPVQQGDIVIHDILHTGADIIATRSI